MKYYIFSALVNGAYTQVKARSKVNALKRFKMIDSTIKLRDVSRLDITNNGQSPVEQEYPHLFS